jgi:AAHS family 3-hydroxyphenylpropionic acid transporter
VFWIGGVVPLLLMPLLMRWLPESQAFQRAEPACRCARCLRRATPPPRCCCGWAISFTLLVVYMLINWLPMLLVGQGFAPARRRG